MTNFWLIILAFGLSCVLCFSGAKGEMFSFYDQENDINPKIQALFNQIGDYEDKIAEMDVEFRKLLDNNILPPYEMIAEYRRLNKEVALFEMELNKIIARGNRR